MHAAVRVRIKIRDRVEVTIRVGVRGRVKIRVRIRAMVCVRVNYIMKIWKRKEFSRCDKFSTTTVPKLFTYCVPCYH